MLNTNKMKSQGSRIAKRRGIQPDEVKFRCVQGRSNPNKVFNPGGRTTVASRQRRPVVMNQSMHITLRSDIAHGRLNLSKHWRKIDLITKSLAKSHGIHIFKMANAGNHLHIHLRVTRRLVWKGFISGLAGGIARAVGYRRRIEQANGNMTVGRPFWNARPHSRIVWTGIDFSQINDYVTLNQMEAAGVVPPRKHMRKGTNWRRVVKINRDD